MIIQAYHPRIGGAERQVASVAPLLQAQGVDVHVLTRRFAGLKAFEVVDGVPVHRLPIPGPKALASLTFTAAALALLRRLEPGIIHAHGLLSPATTALAAKRLFRTPVVVTVHDRGPDGELARLTRRPLAARRRAALRRGVDAFIVISREVEQEIAALGVPPERRAFIANGIDTRRFNPLLPADKRARRAALGLDAPTAVYTGRLVPGKRLDLLLGVWDRVRDAIPGARLLIVGTGPEEAGLRTMAGNGVRFLGGTENVLPLLQAADLFVLPSASEGLSMALLEALAAGLPAVATAVGGNLDVIRTGENGVLVPAGDAASLYAAVVRLFGDAPLRAAMAERARAQVVREFELDRMVTQLRELYARVGTRRDMRHFETTNRSDQVYS